MEFKKASRKKVKLRLNISAPSGAGKTYSALLLAKGLVGEWDKIGVIDTENESASLYEHLGPFNTLALNKYSPEDYIAAINAGVNAGFECLIIDSSSHEWDGLGGCIDLNEKLAQSKYKGNTWSAWNEITPRHDRFVQTILQAPVHIITCTRSKMETVMGEGKKVHKVGMKDIQRSGWEYELTLSLNIERETHTATASKDRTELFEGKDPFVITEATGVLIKDWCDKGVDVGAEKAAALLAARNLITGAKTLDELKTIYTGLSKELQAATVADKDAMKLKLTPTPWQLTPDQQKQAQSLMDSSTMDTARRVACAIAIATCTTQDGFDKIIAHLQTLQSA